MFESPSTDYNRKLTTGGDSLARFNPFASGAAFDAGLGQIDGAVDYLKKYVENLSEALGKTQSGEEHNKDVLNKTGQQQQEPKPGGIAG